MEKFLSFLISPLLNLFLLTFCASVSCCVCSCQGESISPILFFYISSFFLSLLCYRTYQQQSFLLTYLLCLSLLLLLVDVHFVWLSRSDPMGKYRKSIGLERQKNQGADMAHKENKREREKNVVFPAFFYIFIYFFLCVYCLWMLLCQLLLPG